MSKTLQNFYRETVKTAWTAVAGNFYVTTKPTVSPGWLVISPNSATLREIIYYTATGTDGGGDFVTVALSGRGVGGTVAQTHVVSEPIRMNITSETWADLYVDTTFTGTMVVPTPTLATHAATKAYADGLAIAGSPDSTTSTKGIGRVSVAPVSATIPIFVGDNDTRLDRISVLNRDYVVDTGAADAYVITPSPVIASYVTGQTFSFRAVNANTTTSTINVNGLGVKTIKKLGGSADLIANDILASQVVLIEYDGTNFQMISSIGNPQPTIDGTNFTNISAPLTKIAVSTTDVEIVSSTVETTLFSTSIPANTLGAGGAIRVRIYADSFRISNTKTFTLRVKYGATTIITNVITFNGPGSQSDSMGGVLDVYLLSAGTTSSQKAWSSFVFGFDTGNISFVSTANTPETIIASGKGTSAEDSTMAQTLLVSAQFNNSSTVDIITTRMVVVDRIVS